MTCDAPIAIVCQIVAEMSISAEVEDYHRASRLIAFNFEPQDKSWIPFLVVKC
jgi:hypothetical protein